ncbi:hypothetical protein [Ruminiclostridium josui]|uniref:hypothetical protein n=1 Tax=Ruminiclostridium josui TaxID=1499 RepID=UPI00046495BC|nr:hypothetical protein [Ruminiclostridium josui]
MDTKLIMEFEKLKGRLRNAKEYERTQYMTDTPENKARAERTLQQVLHRMAEIWEQLSLNIELDMAKSTDDLVAEIQKYSKQFLYPVKMKYFKKSQRVFVRLEPPAYWLDLTTTILNE